MTAPDAALWTYDQAAAYLNVKPSWLRDKVAARLVPCTRIGRHVRFTREQCDEIIAAGEDRPVSRRRPIRRSA